MVSYPYPLRQIWIDDHLDLYNYARTIGDEEWQQGILQTLADMENQLAQHFHYQLWRMFDAVNYSMLKLVKQLEDQRNEEEAELLRAKVWQLKQQRIEIVKLIRANRG